MKHLKALPNNITMPFIPLDINSNQIFIVGAMLNASRTFYALHLIEENSLKWNKHKCLVYFASNKRQTIKQSGFGAMLHKSEYVHLNRFNSAIGEHLLDDITNNTTDFNPDYIVIDGIEKCFTNVVNAKELLKEVGSLLSNLQLLSNKKNIPIILTTSILLSGETRVFHSRPLLCDFGSSVLEIKAHHVCGLPSPFYDGDNDNSPGEDMWSTMQIYQLYQDSSVVIPNEYEIDKDAGRFYPKRKD